MEYAFFQEEPLWAFSPEPFLLPPAIPAPPAPPTPRSAFLPYSSARDTLCRPVNSLNIHRRMLELLRRIPKETETKHEEGSRGFRHMMRERHRREKLSQSYADLYTILSNRSKPDKNSIVQSAAMYVRELKGVKEELSRHNDELRARVSSIERRCGREEVKFRMGETTTSSIDSMIGALRFLKSMEVKATAMRTEFTGGEMAAVVKVEMSKARVMEVERAMERRPPPAFALSSGLDWSRARFAGAAAAASWKVAT